MLQRCGTLTIVSTAVAASSSDRIRAALAHYVVAVRVCVCEVFHQTVFAALSNWQLGHRRCHCLPHWPVVTQFVNTQQAPPPSPRVECFDLSPFRLFCSFSLFPPTDKPKRRDVVVVVVIVFRMEVKLWSTLARLCHTPSRFASVLGSISIDDLNKLTNVYGIRHKDLTTSFAWWDCVENALRRFGAITKSHYFNYYKVQKEKLKTYLWFSRKLKEIIYNRYKINNKQLKNNLKTINKLDEVTKWIWRQNFADLKSCICCKL